VANVNQNIVFHLLNKEIIMEEFKSIDIKFENDTLNELVQKLNECFYSQ